MDVSRIIKKRASAAVAGDAVGDNLASTSSASTPRVNLPSRGRNHSRPTSTIFSANSKAVQNLAGRGGSSGRGTRRGAGVPSPATSTTSRPSSASSLFRSAASASSSSTAPPKVSNSPRTDRRSRRSNLPVIDRYYHFLALMLVRARDGLLMAPLASAKEFCGALFFPERQEGEAGVDRSEGEEAADDEDNAKTSGKAAKRTRTTKKSTDKKENINNKNSNKRAHLIQLVVVSLATSALLIFVPRSVVPRPGGGGSGSLTLASLLPRAPTWLSGRTTFCSTFAPGAAEEAGEFCVPCPTEGTCRGGNLVGCDAPFVAAGGSCVRDELLLKRAAQMAEVLETELATMKGRRECVPEGREVFVRSEAADFLRRALTPSDSHDDAAAFEFLFSSPQEIGGDADYSQNGTVVSPPTLRRTGGIFFSTRTGVRPLSCTVSIFFWRYVPSALVGGSLAGLFFLQLFKSSRKRFLRDLVLRTVEQRTTLEPVVSGVSFQELLVLLPDSGKLLGILQSLRGEGVEVVGDAEEVVDVENAKQQRGKSPRFLETSCWYSQKVVDALAPAKEVEVVTSHSAEPNGGPETGGGSGGSSRRRAAVQLF